MNNISRQRYDRVVRSNQFELSSLKLTCSEDLAYASHVGIMKWDTYLNVELHCSTLHCKRLAAKGDTTTTTKQLDYEVNSSHLLVKES